jgi:hypothetical protein
VERKDAVASKAEHARAPCYPLPRLRLAYQVRVQYIPSAKVEVEQAMWEKTNTRSIVGTVFVFSAIPHARQPSSEEKKI